MMMKKKNMMTTSTTTKNNDITTDGNSTTKKLEKILFGSHSEDIEISFTFSDHSLSSDDDLLPIDSYNNNNKKKKDITDSDKDNEDVEYIRSVNGRTDGQHHHREGQPTNNTGSPLFKMWNRLSQQSSTSSAITVDGAEEDMSKRVQYYKQCPLCMATGPKSIAHIKQCANRRSIDPKRMVQLLANCQKTTELVVDNNANQRSKKSRTTRRKAGQLANNYVLSFDGSAKTLRLSREPIDANGGASDSHRYQLSALGVQQRQMILMSKINDEILSNDSTTLMSSSSDSKPADEVVICSSQRVLPNLWRLSLLDSESDEYFVNGFHKYWPSVQPSAAMQSESQQSFLQ